MKNSFWIRKNHFILAAVICMILLPVAAALICMCIGRMSLPVQEVIRTLAGALFHGKTGSQNYSIIMNLGLPRILMAVIIGAGLTCAGDTFQALFSNPLATPDILGVSSGTCVGAILAILMSRSILETQLIALVFSLASVWITLRLARNRESQSIVFLVLAGVIISSLFDAVGSLLKYTADPMNELPETTYWLMGSFTSASYKEILIGSPLILIGTLIIYLLRFRLNILSLSEDEAKASGIDLKKTRLIFILAATMITASCVSMCGQVGWGGLLIPHCARMLTGSNNHFVIPVSISLGPNGIGKTTLLKCMVGLLKWKSGRSILDGRDIDTLSSRQIWSRISYIPQSHGFAFSFTGLEMVMLGRSAHLGVFEQPGSKELMILDEPETGLDFHNQILILDMIERLAHDEGICAVMNTHYPTNALSVSDYAFMLDNEGGFLYGPTGEVLDEENISRSFEVHVAVNEFQYRGKTVKSIVPISLAEEKGG